MPWWREPLLQCVVIGAALFAGYEVWFAAPDKSADTIRVTEQQLIRFIEQRTKAFDETTARRRLDAMDTDARTALIEDYVREEAQYRTATQWGLAEDDYVIRRRLVQQVAFVAEGTPSGEIDTQELQVFFRAHRDRYAEPERITLTHVFLRNADDAQTRARALLSTLNDNAITPNQATRYGERFAYAHHVAERSAAELEAILGPQVRAAALKVPVAPTQWHGPLHSEHGWHLINVSRRIDAHMPELAQIRSRVERDFRAHRASVRRKAFVDALVARYRVIVE